MSALSVKKEKIIIFLLTIISKLYLYFKLIKFL